MSGKGARRSWAGANWAAPATVGRAGGLRVYPYGDVWIVEADAPPEDLGDDVDHAVQTALAECPDGVVLVLPEGMNELTDTSVASLSPLTRHADAWPETPVVVACGNAQVREALRERLGTSRLAFASSMLAATALVADGPHLLRAELALPRHPASVGAARRFLARTCEEWHVAPCADAGALVVSELAANAVQHTAEQVRVVLVSDGVAMVRVGVRDQARDAPATVDADHDSLNGRGLVVVEALSQACGALPTGDGGKLVWARIEPELDLGDVRP
ncbi:ATP-binding protein [Knoellia sp. 3-2P3]|uniref:ATP-binding protein n=1 Tax=unclassified Knoellia TaxID=2618719 RepID=UPI0023DA3864|nr:ATP-binding protein [Knoellia sp. 3-2P3]MDF2092183.1 ATP-binding protein [Knoellia sp. 3-2P3]